MNASHDTIAAISTANGRGGIGVVRVSGPLAHTIATSVLEQTPEAGRFAYTPFLDTNADAIDYGVALYFASPHSYTGEDVLELQGHGGPAVLELLLQRVLSVGARIARPGEFTERAFLNDKLDLAQAEAVIDLIESANATAARAAVRSLGGGFSEQVMSLREQLIDLRVYVEAALDFSDEEIDFLSSNELRDRATRLSTAFELLQANARQGQLLKEGLTLVIAGATNVGKSSLLNSLTGTDSAIVTDIAGTTRDVLREHIHLDGLPLHIIDTAGIRDSSDPVEQEGIRRAKKEIANADRIILVLDATNPDAVPVELDLPSGIPVDTVYNKIDIDGIAPSIESNSDDTNTGVAVRLSAKTGQGVELLTGHLQQSVGYQQHAEGVFLARGRHVEALVRAYAATQKALAQLRNSQSPELAAEDLRDAQQALNEITGEFTSDDLLGRIFAGFCIGK